MAVEGDNVTILIIKPSRAKEVGDNPARVFESRDDAEAARDAIDVPTRMIDAPLIEAGQDRRVREIHLSGPGAIKIAGGVPPGDVEVVLDGETEVEMETHE